MRFGAWETGTFLTLPGSFTPLTLVTCFHSGCSYCIRKAVQESNICPLCREPADDTKIRVNRDLERVVTEWRTRSRCGPNSEAPRIPSA